MKSGNVPLNSEGKNNFGRLRSFEKRLWSDILKTVSGKKPETPDLTNVQFCSKPLCAFSSLFDNSTPRRITQSQLLCLSVEIIDISCQSESNEWLSIAMHFDPRSVEQQINMTCPPVLVFWESLSHALCTQERRWIYIPWNLRGISLRRNVAIYHLQSCYTVFFG